jgi:uncharacterized Zn finger protein (UPF0148 family)
MNKYLAAVRFGFTCPKCGQRFRPLEQDDDGTWKCRACIKRDAYEKAAALRKKEEKREEEERDKARREEEHKRWIARRRRETAKHQIYFDQITDEAAIVKAICSQDREYQNDIIHQDDIMDVDMSKAVARVCSPEGLESILACSTNASAKHAAAARLAELGLGASPKDRLGRIRILTEAELIEFSRNKFSGRMTLDEAWQLLHRYRRVSVYSRYACAEGATFYDGDGKAIGGDECVVIRIDEKHFASWREVTMGIP